MIFVTVGMHYQGFERLIKKMDEIAEKIEEKVIMQIGCTKYQPENAEFFDFVDADEKILDLFKQARVIVSHAGAGTLLVALSFGKPIIVVPRLKKFGEHVDDQQLELADVLSEAGKVIAVYDVEKLEEAFKNVDKLAFVNVEKDKKLISFLKECLRRMEK